MFRLVGTAAFIALIGISWLVVELTNIWPFNADRVFALRAVFAGFALAAVCSFILARSRLLPPMLLLAAFVATSAMSRAVLSAAFIMTAGAIVLLSGLLSRRSGPTLNVR